MQSSDTPKDGDFASYLEGGKKPSAEVSASRPDVSAEAPSEAPPQTLEQVLVEGQDPTEEFLERWNDLQNAPELSDEEIERQALEAGGDDDDPNTPE
ncbi:hypothetical protein H8N03_14080 [Ramlibacter sp. USB13]|uniref:Uncharacterized protein n=1 Tax=Ramlibacter cellulosilyticus TaxID=2764187 RepID=A0A923SBN3_9BURK|nr:hypothetical protein [Ramlibacter cellulosilyticus]MBC5784076.1 hypothetical protein [Ramlibacter cellulosilyticus]